MSKSAEETLAKQLKESEERCAELMSENLELQASKQELMSSQGLIQSALNNSPEGIITFSSDNTVETFNHAAQKILEVAEIDVLYQRIEHLFLIPEEFETLTQYMRAYCQTHSDHEMLDDPLYAVRPDGSKIPLRVTISEVRSADMILFDDSSDDLFGDETEVGATEYDMFFCMLHDLSGQQHLKELVASQQEALARTSEIKNNFLSNISHELLTPLNGIIPLTDLLKDEPLNETQLHYIDVIQGCSYDLKKVVTSILQFSKAQEMDALHLEMVPVEELKSCITDSFHECRANQVIEFQIAADNLPAELKLDKRRVLSIVERLIDNAVKFTPEGQISVTIELIDDECFGLLISVADTGVGIDKEQLPHIFKSFQQGDGSKTRKFGGVGLGLTLVNQFVTDVQGKITVESVVDKGTTFHVYLPQEKTAEVHQHAELDPSAFKAIADIMGSAVTAVLDGYLAETTERLHQLFIDKGDNDKLVATLRDTMAGSQQMGASGLARQCGHIMETIADLSEENKQVAFEQLQEEFERVTTELSELCQKVAS